MKRPSMKWLLGAGAAVGLTALLTRWPNVNDVQTGRTPEYPDLQPQRYPDDPDRVFLAAQEVGHAMPGWKLGDIDPASQTFRAEAAVAFTPFVDDVWVEVQPEGEGSVVHARSKSRAGKGDFGVNARRIRAFFAALDDSLRSKGGG
ncbi:MAG: DUF1499 domain-containing protein [Armatimonadetes bacterium]|nr:DUF1499 domain-containing protein [Armatimonadota bacterium]